jgi:hypothetical protein
MATLKHVTTANYTKDIDNPVPVFGSIYNEAVDQINLNTSAIIALIGTTQTVIDSIEGQNSTLGGTTMVTPTYKILVSLTSANLLGMNAAPVTVIAAPGAGKAIRLKSCVAIFDSTETQYANGGVIYLSYNNTTPITNNLAATFLAAGDKVYQLNPLAAAGGINTLVNTALTITNDTAPFITGTGVARLLVEYDVITTGL